MINYTLSMERSHWNAVPVIFVHVQGYYMADEFQNDDLILTLRIYLHLSYIIMDFMTIIVLDHLHFSRVC